MNPILLILASVLDFLLAIAPEVRERCAETTYQKLQNLITEIKDALENPALAAPLEFDDSLGLPPPIADLLELFKTELTESKALRESQVQALAGVAGVLDQICSKYLQPVKAESVTQL